MRLIDADAFKKWLIDHSITFQEVQEAIQIGVWIDNFPSAQPELIEKVSYIRGFEQGRTQGMIESQGRKKGNWIVYKAPDKQHCGLVNCPFCGEEMIAEADEYNFCPNCGADMRGDLDG